MPELQLRPLWLTIGWALVALIVWLSLTPSPSKPAAFPGIDKLGHLLAYFVLTAWFMQIYPGWPARVLHGLLFAVLGIGLEFLQGWGGIRYFEFADMLANTAGVLAGLALGLSRGADLLSRLEPGLRRG